jgi:type IV pilus assembly protein PilB
MIVLTNDTITKIVNTLLDNGLVSATAVEKARANTAQPILSQLIAGKELYDEALSHATAVVFGATYVRLVGVRVDPDILNSFTKDVEERQRAVPLGEIDGKLVIAVQDPSNIQAIDYLSVLARQPVKIKMSSEAGINHAISQYQANVKAIADKKEDEDVITTAPDEAMSIATLTQDSSISKTLDTLLEFAAKNKASDIHIEPLENSIIVRCRIDGVLRRVSELPKSVEAALVSRVKIQANLKIDERRVPQDGQFTIKAAGREIDLRIATSPVVWGEQVVIRLLDKSGTSMLVEDMGMAGRTLRTVRAGANKPNGMILTSGPTGSGKTTTLYALIKEIMNESINIVTLEDPVEYKMDGVNQIQVNVEAGLTFASGLRSILRQDPDVVMVGEIRDAETANLAVQAALTGHLVLSTLHTNSAAGILPRLLDMGIEPFLIASTLNTVIGQRLLRRVAKDRTLITSTEQETARIKTAVGHLLPKTAEEVASIGTDLGYPALPLADSPSFQLVKGNESPDAPGGYQGRSGIFEAIEVDEDIQKMIVKQATAAEINNLALQKGAISMRQDGIFKAISGITTLIEVDRVSSDIA